MTEFLAIITSFPTVIFTVPLALASAYWAVVVMGAVDIDVLDLDLDLDASEAVEGATEGGAFLWLANALRLRKVPVTVSLSLLAFWGWIAAFVLTWLTPDATITAAASFVGALVISAMLTNLTSRPFEPIFRSTEGRDRSSLTGEVCEIRTSRVDDRFGQATAMVGSDDLVLQVRCDTANNGLASGGKALIVHYDERREAFVVEPLATVETDDVRARTFATHTQREA